MHSLIVFIIFHFMLLLSGQWIDYALAVTQERLNFKTLRPLLGEFRRQKRTICHQEQGRLECPPSPPSRLHIFSASYGQDFALAATCNHVYSPFNRQVLRETCQFRSVLKEATSYCANRNPCQMRSNQFRSKSDNCQGVPKYLQFEYTCLPEKKQIQFICADSYVEVQCDSFAERLLVISAKLTSNHTYKKSYCRQFDKTVPSNVHCPEKDATSAVKTDCNKKSSCSVMSPPPSVYRDPTCPKLNTILEYVCVNRKLLKKNGRSQTAVRTTMKTKKKKPADTYVPKWPNGRPPIEQKKRKDSNYGSYTTPESYLQLGKETDSDSGDHFWLRVGLIIAGVLLFALISSFVVCQVVIRRRNRQKRAKMIRDIARQKVEDDFVKKHLGPPTSWSFPSPVSSTNGDRLNMSESWIEPTDRFIMYDWPLRKSYHGDQNLSSSLTRQKQQQQPQTQTQKPDQTAIDATLPHFYHM